MQVSRAAKHIGRFQVKASRLIATISEDNILQG
jgi:hypothetical protein